MWLRKLFILSAGLLLAFASFGQHVELKKAIAQFKPMYNYEEFTLESRSGELYFPINSFEKKKLEGDYLFLQYRHSGEGAVPENGDIMLHYLEQAKAQSGQGIHRSAAHATYKAVVGDHDLRFLIEVYEGGTLYSIVFMKLGTIATTAEEQNLLEELNNKGRVSLYFNFETGESGLSSQSENDLQKVVEVMKKTTSLRIKVEGHTDNVGSEEANQKLSEMRATAIQDYLIEQGISKDRIIAEGFGSSKPIASNDTEEGRNKNRRVDLVKLD